MAWDILRNEFEDLYRVMRAREDKIVSLGSYPSSGRGSAPLKKQVERLMNLPASPFTIVRVTCGCVLITSMITKLC